LLDRIRLRGYLFDMNIPASDNSAPPAPKKARYISISNQKGGVGKTTTTINLATALAAVGKKVLVVDLDPQGNASTGLGIDRASRVNGSYEVLFGECDVDTAAAQTKVPGLYVIPASIHLSGAELELVEAPRRERRMKGALEKAQMPYDYVLFDCPPSLNLLTLNALVASDGVLVPLQCEFFALEGLSHLVKTIERVKSSFNDNLELLGIVLTMYDKRNSLSRQVSDNVREFFGDKVYDTVIPRNVRISEAPSHGLPAIVYDMHCSGSQAYIQLAKELIKRERAQEQAKQPAEARQERA
jgi:chromosome partitioning protein